VVRAVGIDEHEDAGGRGLDRQPHRLPLAAAVVLNDLGAVLDGDGPGPITRVPVDDEHFIAVRTHGIDDFADQPFFVLGGDDYCDTGNAHEQTRRAPTRATTYFAAGNV